MRTNINVEGIPLDVADMVQYQEGSIISRELYVKAIGTITVFAFDKDQGLSEHSAPFDAFVYILDGQAKVSIAGEWKELKPGQLLLMPANVPHAVQSITAFKMLLLMFRESQKKAPLL
jgi:quercetin dioxygenase-like cupin family protein